MKIVFISDTHGHFPNLPEGDVLVHAGDATMMGTVDEVEDFYRWLWLETRLKFKHVIFTPGNHDFFFEKDSIIQRHNAFINRGVVIDGVSFWASPYSNLFGSWAFMKNDNDLIEVWKQIPDDVDVLITHGPPQGILDRAMGVKNAGSFSLLDKVREVKPKIHVFGHIHEAAGSYCTNGTQFVNASVVNEYYENVNRPVVVDL